MQHVRLSIITLALAAILLTLHPAAAQATAIDTNTGSNWKRHTAFDGQVRKIMEGPRYVYIWAHQQLYTQANGTRSQYSNPNGTVLYIDKQNLTNGVRSLADDFPTAGLDARCVYYDPVRGMLVMAYTNGMIDVVTDSREIHTIQDFAGLNGGLTITPKNIAIDKENGDIWITSSNGFARIDGKTFKAVDSADWGASVNSVCRVGDRVVAIVDNVIYTAHIDTSLGSLGNLTSQSNTGGSMPAKIHGIMPVSANAFITLTEGKNICLVQLGLTGNITSITTQLTDTGFSGQLLAANGSLASTSSSISYINFNYYVNDEFENNFVPTQDGYLAYSKDYIYSLKYNPDTNKIDSQSRKFNTGYISALARQTSSYDFENFWFYELRKGFYCEKASGYGNSTTWTTGSPRIQWKGLTAMRNAQLKYSSTKGMICMSRTSTMFNNAEVSPLPLLMSGYKNGIWTNYSPIYTTPDFCNTNSAAKTKFENTKYGEYAYPIRHPNSFIVDPLNPDYVLVGSMYSGIAAMNLDNITRQILHFSYEQDTNYSFYPGFASVIPGNAKGCPALYVCGTDQDGNLWIFFPDSMNSNGGPLGLRVFCWKASDYNNSLENQNVSNYGSWTKLAIPTGHTANMPGRLAHGLALKHKNNQNKILIFPSTWGHPLMILDHNGTLEDTSDDKVSIITYFATPTGLLTHGGYIYVIEEDSLTGDVTVPVASNLVRFNPNSPVIDNTIKAEVVNLANRDGSMTPIVQYQSIYSLSFDEYNRMWIGTGNEGVYGISADRKNVIAHYTTENSPLLSNQINDICWNPDTQDLFIATDGGLMSMTPYTLDSENGKITPSVEPTSVTPDFAGVIRLNNIPSGSSIIVEDENGKKVSTLINTANNNAIWDTSDSNGNLVPSGVYYFHDLSGLMDDIHISILR